jgi:hypothetical protein
MTVSAPTAEESGEVSGLDEILVSAQALESVLQLVSELAWLSVSD